MFTSYLHLVLLPLPLCITFPITMPFGFFYAVFSLFPFYTLHFPQNRLTAPTLHYLHLQLLYRCLTLRFRIVFLRTLAFMDIFYGVHWDSLCVAYPLLHLLSDHS